MTSQLETVLEIAGVGTVLLFIALVALVGLMYLLTLPWPFGRSARPAEPEPVATEIADALREEEEERAEQDRQLRAVALAVGVACAEAERPATSITTAMSDWGRAHRSYRLGQQKARARVRT